MRIVINKVVEGKRFVTVVPGRAKRLAPIMVSGTDKRSVVAAVEAVVRELQGDPALPQGGLFP